MAFLVDRTRRRRAREELVKRWRCGGGGGGAEGWAELSCGRRWTEGAEEDPETALKRSRGSG